MHSSRRTGRPPAGPRRPAGRAACAVALAAVLLGACSAPQPTERFDPGPAGAAGAVEEGITYWSEGDESLQLDACLPPAGVVLARAGAPAAETAETAETADGTASVTDAPAPAGTAGTAGDAPVPAVVVVHGGGFTSGGRDEPGVRAVCEQVSRLGVAAFAISYRLAPEHVYPAQVDDLAHAVEWLRQPAQVERFHLDPARVGVVGSSAGAILAQSLATRGEGPLDQGSRVAAAVSLSGVSVMGPEGLRLGDPSREAAAMVLGYLGCPSLAGCAPAVEASPVTAVDPTDTPLLLVSGSDEIVPQEQAQAMGEALRAAGVAEQVVVRPGDGHGLALLDATVRDDVKTFLEEHL